MAKLRSGASETMRPVLALCCGALAIDVNTVLLALVDGAGLPTARGGLLRLLLRSGTAVLGEGWQRRVVPTATTAGFQTAFHIVVGLLMALLFAALTTRVDRRYWWRLAWLYAAAVWLLNAAVVLPALGEGFAGSNGLSLAGMAAFAVIHTVFFLLLAGLYRGLAPAVGRVYP